MNRAWSAFIWVILLLTGVETISHGVEYIRPEVEDVTFDYAPYRMLRMTSAPFALNSDGFRAAELDSYRGKFLVEFLGGSVCLGVGTNPGKPVPERLEEALRRAGMKDARVLNLCQGGTTSAQELAIFIQHGLRLRPQIVISFNGANDLMHPRPLGEDDAPNLPYHDREMRALFGGRHSWLEHFAVKRISDRIARHLPKPDLSLKAANPVPPSSILDSYFSATNVTRTLAEAHGGVYGLALQPTLHYAKQWSAEESMQWASRRPKDAKAASAYARSLYQQARDAAREWARQGGKLYDLTAVFANTPTTIYSDSVHFQGEAGFRMLEEELEKQGLVALIAERYRAWQIDEAADSDEKRSMAWAH